MVERHLAKVDVAGSIPVSRSYRSDSVQPNRFFFNRMLPVKER
ncbi:hypothetical protein TREVI0001_0663 [Treponema vincentii ATCC 35580]|uniref:Uncharacterized protein n=1 Tax=Treponema vincentii ATCC 35580 TaxID=596324 RepID=C8PMP5_9SPIR|nr:hypothetical protein TREVI0001_0663 [Treponema vincentii ATCC 35580]